MLITKNKKAYFDYEILKEFSTGMILTGAEVRSCRAKQVDLKGAYVSEIGEELWLKGAKIHKFKHDQTGTHEVERNRKLLLNKKEIIKIITELNTSGVTLIPLEIFTLGPLLKLKIALARGRKKYDKRELIKNRDIERRKY